VGETLLQWVKKNRPSDLRLADRRASKPKDTAPRKRKGRIIFDA